MTQIVFAVTFWLFVHIAGEITVEKGGLKQCKIRDSGTKISQAAFGANRKVQKMWQAMFLISGLV